MDNQLTHEIKERCLPLINRIEQLEQGTIIQGVDAIERYSTEIDAITREIDALAALALEAGDAFSRQLEKTLRRLPLRLQSLPQVPRIEVVRLAQSVLAQKPLVLLTDDIINEETDRPELTRIFLMEPTEAPCFDYHFAPSLHENVHILELDTTEKVSDTTTPLTSLEVAWSQLQNTIYGRYVIAFDLPLVQLQLGITAQKYGLAVPMLIGHSMLDLLLLYVGIKGPISYEIDGPRLSLTNAELSSLMEREDVIPFYGSSLAPADQRARHILHALQKMADGTFSLQEPGYDPAMSSLDPFS